MTNTTSYYSRDEEQARTRAALRVMADARPAATDRQRAHDVRNTARAVVKNATRAANSFKVACDQRARLESARDVANDILGEIASAPATTTHGERLANAVGRVMYEAICYCGNGASYMTAIDNLRDAEDDARLIARGCALREPRDAQEQKPCNQGGGVVYNDNSPREDTRASQTATEEL